MNCFEWWVFRGEYKYVPVVQTGAGTFVLFLVGTFIGSQEELIRLNPNLTLIYDEKTGKKIYEKPSGN